MCCGCRRTVPVVAQGREAAGIAQETCCRDVFCHAFLQAGPYGLHAKCRINVRRIIRPGGGSSVLLRPRQWHGFGVLGSKTCHFFGAPRQFSEGNIIQLVTGCGAGTIAKNRSNRYGKIIGFAIGGNRVACIPDVARAATGDAYGCFIGFGKGEYLIDQFFCFLFVQ